MARTSLAPGTGPASVRHFRKPSGRVAGNLSCDGSDVTREAGALGVMRAISAHNATKGSTRMAAFLVASSCLSISTCAPAAEAATSGATSQGDRCLHPLVRDDIFVYVD